MKGFVKGGPGSFGFEDFGLRFENTSRIQYSGLDSTFRVGAPVLSSCEEYFW